MRLDQEEIEAIKRSAREAFGPTVAVSLFGSRVRDDLKGGDIDLLFEVDPGFDTIDKEVLFLKCLFESIEEQKVDLVLVARGSTPSAFAKVAMARAVRLP